VNASKWSAKHSKYETFMLGLGALVLLLITIEQPSLGLSTTVVFVLPGIWIVHTVRKAKAARIRELQNATLGAQRIETVGFSGTGKLISEYKRYGWTLLDQSSAKSFGSALKITLRFRKE